MECGKSFFNNNRSGRNFAATPGITCCLRKYCLGIAAIIMVVAFAQAMTTEKPISLHPENPHYFLFLGEPTILITSGEHYSAVINLDFDYTAYLNELHSNGLNLTRTKSGTYVESPGSFKISQNTQAPAPNRFICPWARSAVRGYAGGGNKFDLTKWDEDYFKRLRDFFTKAGKRGIVVEFVLFSSYHRQEKLWALSPLNAKNNINNIGDVTVNAANTLQNGNLLAVQEALVRKVAQELKEFDNLYYEICNEPYTGAVLAEWENHIASVITDAEKSFPSKHLIAQNIANGSKKIENPNPAVSVFNFHYSSPPDVVALNYNLNKVIGNNETGFCGIADKPYRIQGWEFILAGGALYNNLDYSFTVLHPGGTYKLPPDQDGGGSPSLRKQLGILKNFIYGFDFIRMKPDNSVIKSGLTPGMSARALVEDGRQYAIYIRGGSGIANLEVKLPRGRYEAKWLNIKTGKTEKAEKFRHKGGTLILTSPSYSEDIALSIKTSGIQ